MRRIAFLGAVVLASLVPEFARADLILGTSQIVSQSGNATFNSGYGMISGSVAADGTNMGFADVSAELTFTQTFQIVNAPGGQDVYFTPEPGGEILTGFLYSEAHASFSIAIDSGIGRIAGDGIRVFNPPPGGEARFSGLDFNPQMFHLADGTYTATETLAGGATIGNGGLGGQPRQGTTASFNASVALGFYAVPVPEPTSLAHLAMGTGVVFIGARRARPRRRSGP